MNGVNVATRGIVRTTRGFIESTRGNIFTTRGFIQSTRGSVQSTRGSAGSTLGFVGSTRGIVRAMRGFGGDQRPIAASFFGLPIDSAMACGSTSQRTSTVSFASVVRISTSTRPVDAGRQ